MGRMEDGKSVRLSQTDQHINTIHCKHTELSHPSNQTIGALYILRLLKAENT